MKAKLLFISLLVTSFEPMLAEEPQPTFDAAAPAKTKTEWKYDPALWRDLFTEKRDEPTIAIGRSDVVVSGPLVDTFRRPRSGWSDLSLGQKILSLPIINLFVPMKMPSAPTTGGKYLAWRARSDSVTPSVRGAAATGAFNEAVNAEAGGVINLSW